MSKDESMSSILDQQTKSEDPSNKRDTLLNRLFFVYDNVMKERATSAFVAIILISIMFLQLIAYPFDGQIAFPFKDKLGEPVSKIIGYIRIIPPIETAHSSKIYLLFCFVMLIVVIVYFCLLLYIDYSLKTGKFIFKFPIGMVSFISSLLYWVLLTPSIEGFAKIFVCKDGVHAIMSDVQCWSKEHIGYMILFIVGLIGMVLALGLISLLYNEFRSQSLDSLSRLDCNFEIYLASYRIIVALLSTLCYESKTHWLLILVYTAGSLYLLYYYVTRIPYYNQIISKVFGGCIMCYLCTNLTLVLAKMFESEDLKGEIIVLVISFPCSFFLMMGVRNYILYHLLFSEKFDKIKHCYILDLYTRKLEELIVNEKLNESDSSILYGYLLCHKAECSNTRCPLISKSEYYLPSSNSVSGKSMVIQDHILLLHLLNSIYTEYTQQLNADATTHIIYSYFMFTRIGNMHTALMELSNAEKCKCSVQQRLSIVRFKKFIEISIKDKYKKGADITKPGQNLDVSIVINFEAIFINFQKCIEHSCNKYIEFWTHLNSLMPDLNILHKLGLSIIFYSKKTHDLWSKLCSINPDYPTALHIYGIYLKDIKNDEEAGNQCIEKEKKLRISKPIESELNEYDIMFSDRTAIIIISGSKEAQGKIEKTNFGVINLLEYNPNELIGRDASIIMPPIIGVRHNSFLEEYFSVGKERIINKEKKLFAMTHGRSLIYVSISVKLSSTIEHEISYIALIVEIPRSGEYMLTDSEGKIDSMTKAILSKFEVTSSNFFQEYNTYIHLIIPELMDKINIDGKELSRFASFKSGDTAVVHMIIPKAFVNIVQSLNKYSVNASEDADENEIKDVKNVKSFQNFESTIKYSSKVKASDASALTSFIDYKEADFQEEVKLEVNDEVYGTVKPLAVRIIKITLTNLPNQSEESCHENEQIQYTPHQNNEKESDGHKPAAKPNDNPKILNDRDVKVQQNDGSNLDKMFIKNAEKKAEVCEDPSMLEKAKKFNSDEIGSMISTGKSIMTYIKKLRSAMYDKSIPSSVKQLKLTAQLLFLIFVGLTVAFYIIQKKLYSKCSESIENIYSSKNRAVSIAGIEYSIRMLYFIANGIVDSKRGTKFGDIIYNDTTLTYENWTRKNLNYYANILKEAQNNLSTSDIILASKEWNKINPMYIDVKYNNSGYLSENSMDCWSSMMGLVMHAKKISSIDKELLNATKLPDSVEYILNNALNSILLQVNESSWVILNRVIQSLKTNDNIFKILLSSSCIALIIAMLILFPVTFRVARNKGKLLSLFMDINQKDVKEQLIKCRFSFNTIRGEYEKQDDDIDDIMEADKKGNKKEENTLGETVPMIKKSKKLFKPYQTKIGLTFMQLIIFTLFLLSYFLYSYLYSNAFFEYISHISYEVFYITQRRRTNSLLLYTEAEMIGTKSKSKVYGIDSINFVSSFIDIIINEQEQLLKTHAQNFLRNDDTYNKLFDSIIYNNTCPVIFDNKSDCYSFGGGILQKGLYAANIAFWDNIREFYYDYQSGITKLLNDNRFINTELMDSRYFTRAYDAIQYAMDDSLKKRFVNATRNSAIMFIAYICIMTVASYLFWTIFLKSTSNSLWVTKSMLSIIPPDIIQKVQKITDFLIKTASLSSSIRG